MTNHELALITARRAVSKGEAHAKQVRQAYVQQSHITIKEDFERASYCIAVALFIHRLILQGAATCL